MRTTEISNTIQSLGAVRTGKFWRVATPGGPLEWEVLLRGRSQFAHVAVDRIFTAHDAPEHAGAWAESNLWPIIRRGVERHGKRSSLYGYGLPRCKRAYSQAHVHKDDLEEILRLWIPQETAWQTEQAT